MIAGDCCPPDRAYDYDAEREALFAKREAAWEKLQRIYEEQIQARDVVIALYRDSVLSYYVQVCRAADMLRLAGMPYPDPGPMPFEEVATLRKKTP